MAGELPLPDFEDGLGKVWSGENLKGRLSSSEVFKPLDNSSAVQHLAFDLDGGSQGGVWSGV